MKTRYKIAIVVIVGTFAFTACKKTKKVTPVGALGANFPYALNNIVTPAIIDTLKSHGMTINPGLTPPAVNGVYFFSPDYCTFDNSGYDQAGEIFADLTFDFTNQNSATATVDMAYKTSNNNNSEVGSDHNATFISGSGNLFTIYAQANDTTQTVPSVLLEIVSGELVNGGIENMQFGFYVKSKDGDPDNAITVAVGTTRIFKDEDMFSDIKSTFFLAPKGNLNGKATNGKTFRSILLSAKQNHQ